MLKENCAKTKTAEGALLVSASLSIRKNRRMLFHKLKLIPVE